METSTQPKAVLVVKPPRFWTSDLEPQRIELTSTGPFRENQRKGFLQDFHYAKVRLGHQRSGPLKMHWGFYEVQFTLDGRIERKGPNTADVTLGYPVVVGMTNLLEGTKVNTKSSQFKDLKKFLAVESKVSLEIVH